MKNKILAACLAAFLFTACSKSGIDNNNTGNVNVVPASAVPAATTAAFTSEFSGATGVEWQKNSSGSFTVEFNHSNQRHSAGYDDNGHRSSHSIICIDGAVPQAVLDAFRQQFPADKVYEWKLKNDGTWNAHIMRGSVKYEAIFSATGALLKFEKSS